MKTPGFWYKDQGLVATLLKPLGWFYEKGGRLLSRLKRPKRFQVPIISIGNIVCGGAGKTPTAIALLQLLRKRGYNVHFVTRGYRGRERGPLMVDPLYHTARDVGDEPLLLAQYAPTWIAKKRYQGVEKAMENGVQLVLLDDGHQTAGLYKDVSFVIIDLLQEFGNGCVIPAGPLREELSAGLKRADGFIGIGKTKSVVSAQVGTQETFHTPLFNAKIVPQPLALPSMRVVAFCGLGFPQKFYWSLQELGIEIVAHESFPDHHQYTNEDLSRLNKLAQKHNSSLITTRKDFVKIPLVWQKRLHVLDICIEFDDPEKICDFILSRISMNLKGDSIEMSIRS